MDTVKDMQLLWLLDTLLHDRLMIDITDNNVRKKLLQVCGLTLEHYIDVCWVSEATDSSLKAMSGIPIMFINLKNTE